MRGCLLPAMSLLWRPVQAFARPGDLKSVICVAQRAPDEAESESHIRCCHLKPYSSAKQTENVSAKVDGMNISEVSVEHSGCSTLIAGL